LTLDPSPTYDASMTNNTKLSARKVFCLYSGFVLLPLGIAVLVQGQSPTIA
jgi:hypothetical protein